MKYSLAVLSFTVTVLSCTEPYDPDTPVVPFAGEYEPVSFITETGGTEHLVQDCNIDLGDFSAELREFVLGNFTIGDSLDSNCSQCGIFSGPYRWSSRCDATYRDKGTWTSTEYGVTLSFLPGSSPDSTLGFTALMSSRDGVWKLRYEKGESFIELRYKRRRS